MTTFTPPVEMVLSRTLLHASSEAGQGAADEVAPARAGGGRGREGRCGC
jgi:hypothetical protein